MRQSDNQTTRRSGTPTLGGTIERKKKIVRHTDLEVYEQGFSAAMALFEASKSFPVEERFSLTDQIRRSSRSVCGNIAEGWRKRRYAASFVSKMNDAEGEAAETQSWLQFATKCGYIKRDEGRQLYATYDAIIAMLLNMQNHPEVWWLTRH